MDRVAPTEMQAAGERPELVVVEGVGLGGVGDEVAGRQLDLDELERTARCRRDGPAQIAGVGVRPARLVVRPHESTWLPLGASEQLRQRYSQGVR